MGESLDALWYNKNESNKYIIRLYHEDVILSMKT